MNVINLSTRRKTIVATHDDRGAGGAYHEYTVVRSPGDELSPVFASVQFQKGGVVDNGINGCGQEDLLCIVLHRLKSFQDGQFPCQENADAIDHIEAALAALDKRTQERVERNVEGKEIN